MCGFVLFRGKKGGSSGVTHIRVPALELVGDCDDAREDKASFEAKVDSSGVRHVIERGFADGGVFCQARDLETSLP